MLHAKPALGRLKQKDHETEAKMKALSLEESGEKLNLLVGKEHEGGCQDMSKKEIGAEP